MMRATRVGAWLLLAIVFVAHAGCSKDTPTSAQVEFVGTLTLTRMGQEISLGEIWAEEGAADLSVKVELSQLKDRAVVVGSGTDTARFDFTGGGCVENGRWDTRSSFGLEATFDNNAHEIHTTTKDGAMEWDNRFEMKRFDSTGVTRCQFNK